MKKRLLISFTLLLTALALHAVPAKPVTKKVQLPDGTVVDLTLRGDEHFSYMTDAAGVPYLMQTNGKVERTTSSIIGEKWTERRDRRLRAMQTSRGVSSRAARRVGTAGETTGKHRGLVILMQFEDVPFVTKEPQATFNRFFNEIGYNENGMSGSVKDYFLAQSYNQLEIDFDVVGPFTTANPMAYYGAHDGDDNDIHPALMIAEAVDAASAVVDYSNYDWDGDKVVDQIFVIFAGYEEAQGADPNTIWPHEYAISGETGSPKNYNGVTIDTYGCAAELRGNGKTSTGILNGIGTACHEFSHCLGLPDMYDTSGQGANFALSAWDVMSSGNYNNNSCTPAGYTSYERWFAGWMEPTELNEMTRVIDMAPLAEKGEAYILYNDNNKNEFYLLENRQPVGFDAGLYGHGLLVLHVDYNQNAWTTNTVNSVKGHERVTIIPADNEKVETVKSLQGDPFPGSTGNDALTNYTTPSASLFNKNTDGTLLMNKSIDNITEDAEKMTVSFVACRPPIAAPKVEEVTGDASNNSFTAKWSAVSGAVGYELELTTIDKASEDPTEALVREFDFKECYSETDGFSDIGPKLSTYGLSGWSGSKLYTTPNKLRFGTSKAPGTLKSPTWKVPASGDITIVMGADIVNKEVNGTISITYGNSGDAYADCPTQSLDFEVKGNTKQVYVFKNVRKDLFWMDIAPQSQMYLNYLAIYDGEWTAEELGISNAAESNRRASTVTTFTTNTNSFTFTNLDVTKRYIYRIRTIGEESTYSQWGEENLFDFSSTGIKGIHSILGTEGISSPVSYYDLQGREVNAGTKGLVIRKQGNDVKKVVVR